MSCKNNYDVSSVNYHFSRKLYQASTLSWLQTTLDKCLQGGTPSVVSAAETISFRMSSS